VRRFDPVHLWLAAGTAAVAAALAGVSMAVCLLILMFAPVVTVIGYETRGYLHQAEALIHHA
jgi:hypothetical protein